MSPAIAEELTRSPRGSLPQSLYWTALEQAGLDARGSDPKVEPTVEDFHAAASRAIEASYPNFLPEPLG